MQQVCRKTMLLSPFNRRHKCQTDLEEFLVHIVANVDNAKSEWSHDRMILNLLSHSSIAEHWTAYLNKKHGSDLPIMTWNSALTVPLVSMLEAGVQEHQIRSVVTDCYRLGVQISQQSVDEDYDTSGVRSTSNGVPQNAGPVLERQATAGSTIDIPRSPVHVEGTAPQDLGSLSNNHNPSSQPCHQYFATTEALSFQGLLSPFNGDHLAESPSLNYEDMTVEQQPEWDQLFDADIDWDPPETVPQPGHASDRADPASSTIGLAITTDDHVKNLSPNVSCRSSREPVPTPLPPNAPKHMRSLGDVHRVNASMPPNDDHEMVHRSSLPVPTPELSEERSWMEW
ncbi:hypothetical protein LTR28_002765 [Elasticomyces elasticus]|nr:hypothetical protein LTR28_002765 [Elasticomyces elasticus]